MFRPHVLWTISILLMLGSGPAPLVAGIVIHLEPSDPGNLHSDARMTFSGSGVITAGGTGTVVDLLNFDPNVFDGLTSTPSDHAFNVHFDGVDASTIANYTQTFQTVRLTNQSSGDDVLLRDRLNADFSFDVGDTYSVFGSSVLSDVKYSDLLAGHFDASETAGDAAKFAGAQLRVGAIAVPEPSSSTYLGIVLAGLALAKGWQRVGRGNVPTRPPRAV